MINNRLELQAVRKSIKHITSEIRTFPLSSVEMSLILLFKLHLYLPESLQFVRSPEEKKSKLGSVQYLDVFRKSHVHIQVSYTSMCTCTVIDSWMCTDLCKDENSNIAARLCHDHCNSDTVSIE
uniref:Uncharacterized protein n=1 Tax=Onchocerca volvulus TaxID=6282 RepID=A0A8R1TXT4_ONCVO